MSTSQLGAIFIGGVLGYWVVSALIDRARKRAKPQTSDAAKPAASLAKSAPAASAPAEPAPTDETPKPVRSVWEEMNGGGS